MFDGHMKVLNRRFGNIKVAVCDLHRDVTTRRCLTSYERVEEIVRECATIKTDLDRADAMMDEHKVEFEKRWQQEVVRLKTEQAVYNDQALELVALKSELRHLLVIAQQLEPYIRSITAMMERVQPEVAGVGEEEDAEPSRGHEDGLRGHEDERIAAILERIQAIKPEYKHRVEALQRGGGEQHREGSNGLRSSGSGHEENKLLRTPSKEGCLLQAPAGPKEASRREPEVSKREETCKDVRREEGKLDCGGRREEYNNRESLARREAAADFKEPARREEYKESGAGRREESGKEGGSCRREEHKDRDRGREDYKESKDGSTLMGGGRETGNGTAMWLATTTEQVKARYPAEKEGAGCDLRPDFDLPEPPLEYCEARKPSEEGKRGILSSIFGVGRSKEESGKKSVECLPFGSKEDHRRSQPLLENLDCTGNLKRSADSVDSMVQKPYEPPALGKSSRITPVGGEEVTAVSSQSANSSCSVEDSVEVLSVIRYNKLKMSAPPSTLHSISGSDTASIMSQGYDSRLGTFQLSKSEARLDQPRNLIVGHQEKLRSQSSSRPEGRESEEGGFGSYLRRSSAPEIDHESPAEEEEREARRRREVSYTRSLERGRLGRGEVSTYSSDCEEHATKLPDKKELQRAVAHLKETLEGKMEKMKRMEAEKEKAGTNQSEIKAVVHRAETPRETVREGGGGGGHPAGKTLDSDSIKQYHNVKQNSTASKSRYSGVFETGRGKQGSSREGETSNCSSRPLIYKQSSFDSLATRGEEGRARESREGHNTLPRGRDSPQLPQPPHELKKQDSFEGHEAAVRSLVEAVHESRKLEARQRKKSEG